MERQLTKIERVVCLILSRLKYSEHGDFYKCFWNDTLMRISCILLKGQNPIDFICKVCSTSTDNSGTK